MSISFRFFVGGIRSAVASAFDAGTRLRVEDGRAPPRPRERVPSPGSAAHRAGKARSLGLTLELLSAYFL